MKSVKLFITSTLSLMLTLVFNPVYAVETSTAASATMSSTMSKDSSSNANQASTSQTSSSSDPNQNLRNSQAFLKENKKKPGINTLPSGLQYKIIREGDGKSPGPNDFVIVHYRGTLIDGTEFDSSYPTKEPATFPMNAVIPGFTEALQLMKPGSQWVIYVPPSLAYGSRGAGKKIGPNSALIFEIELIAVKPPFDENPGAYMSDDSD